VETVHIVKDHQELASVSSTLVAYNRIARIRESEWFIFVNNSKLFLSLLEIILALEYVLELN
jgi:hypothetical protein